MTTFYKSILFLAGLLFLSSCSTTTRISGATNKFVSSEQAAGKSNWVNEGDEIAKTTAENNSIMFNTKAYDKTNLHIAPAAGLSGASAIVAGATALLAGSTLLDATGKSIVALVGGFGGLIVSGVATAFGITLTSNPTQMYVAHTSYANKVWEDAKIKFKNNPQKLQRAYVLLRNRSATAEYKYLNSKAYKNGYQGMKKKGHFILAKPSFKVLNLK